MRCLNASSWSEEPFPLFCSPLSKQKKNNSRSLFLFKVGEFGDAKLNGLFASSLAEDKE
jgi:hypothetical protein